MTSADYLESLQDDLDRTVTALDLDEGTNFTDIADMAENGDISTGGGSDLSEYFGDTITGNNSYPGFVDAIIKLPPLSNTGTSCRNLFYQFKGTFLDLNNLDTSNVTNMQDMFRGCVNLLSLDVSNFDTSSVISYYGMFRECSSLTNLDLSSFTLNISTSNASVSNMFAGCTSLTNVNLSNFGIYEYGGSVSYMFDGCINLRYIDIRKMSFTYVQIYTNMFGADENTGVPNNCEIIVMNNNVKTWITSKFTRLTNVKTVAELEAE